MGAHSLLESSSGVSALVLVLTDRILYRITSEDTVWFSLASRQINRSLLAVQRCRDVPEAVGANLLRLTALMSGLQ